MKFAIHNNIAVISWRSVVSLFVIGNTGRKYTDCLKHFTPDGDCAQQTVFTHLYLLGSVSDYWIPFMFIKETVPLYMLEMLRQNLPMVVATFLLLCMASSINAYNIYIIR